jgi:ubiquinone/menaquinone biosynthesis C-methylase UbiE
VTRSSIVDDINRKTMRNSVASYLVYDEINAAEQVVFSKIGEQYKDKAILDVGVGGGRTTAALTKISANYIGVDYVPEMVAACRARFPHVRFEQVDARSMPQFADRSFDVIVFACNGVSMVDHSGRLAILKEMRRLLAVGGVFMFSTYNRNSAEYERGFSTPDFMATKNPIKYAVRGVRFVANTVYGLFNRLRYRRFEIRTEEYAMINDRCHDYATMLYYITAENQIRQLKSVGFESLPLIYDSVGRLADPACRNDSLTYLVCG